MLHDKSCQTFCIKHQDTFFVLAYMQGEFKIACSVALPYEQCCFKSKCGADSYEVWAIGQGWIRLTMMALLMHQVNASWYFGPFCLARVIATTSVIFNETFCDREFWNKLLLLVVMQPPTFTAWLHDVAVHNHKGWSLSVVVFAMSCWWHHTGNVIEMFGHVPEQFAYLLLTSS